MPVALGEFMPVDGHTGQVARWRNDVQQNDFCLEMPRKSRDFVDDCARCHRKGDWNQDLFA